MGAHELVEISEKLNTNVGEESLVEDSLLQDKDVGASEPEQDGHSPGGELEDSNTSHNMTTSFPSTAGPAKTSSTTSGFEKDQGFVSRVRIAAGLEQMDENREREDIEGDIDISRCSRDSNISDSDLSDFSAHTLRLQLPCEMHERLKEVKIQSCPAPRVISHKSGKSVPSTGGISFLFFSNYNLGCPCYRRERDTYLQTSNMRLLLSL